MTDPATCFSFSVGSMFSGIGGFDLGFERVGIPVAWSCEIDKDARKVLAEHWPTVPCYNDVKELDGTAPGVDVLCGGFPCQDLSVAGNRAGLAGERSGLFHEFMRVAGALAPRWVVIENVPGLLSSEDGRDMGTVLGTLADLGYGWAYRVLDAQFFGVAQRRRRVFIVGCLGDPACAASVLFEPESCDGDSPPSREAGARAATPATVSTLQGGGHRGSRIDAEGAAGGHLVPALRASNPYGDHHGDEGRLVIADTLRSHPRPGSNSLGALAFHQIQDPITEDDLSPALGAKTSGMGVAFSENQRGEVLETEISHQLATGGGKPGQGYPAVRQDMQVRRLTPLECERLQGFPDGWTASLSDSARYRTLGNAVAVPVAQWIAAQITSITQEDNGA